MPSSRSNLRCLADKKPFIGSGSSSPIIKPADAQADNKLPQISAANENIRPGSGKQHQKNGSLSIDGEDYFMSSPKFRGSKATSSSAPSSPNGTKYNVSFSPRITFHDTWPSGEYDRRGDIATCNRLTPMLAQQIKEELNTFKMVGFLFRILYTTHRHN